MCGNDDDPTQHDRIAESPVASLLCPACGHAWRWHATVAGDQSALAHGALPIPCIALGGPAWPSVVDICGCAELAPEPIYRPMRA